MDKHGPPDRYANYVTGPSPMVEVYRLIRSGRPVTRNEVRAAFGFPHLDSEFGREVVEIELPEGGEP